MVGQRTMSALIGDLTGQPFILLVSLTNEINESSHAVQFLSVCKESEKIHDWVKMNLSIIACGHSPDTGTLSDIF